MCVMLSGNGTFSQNVKYDKLMEHIKTIGIISGLGWEREKGVSVVLQQKLCTSYDSILSVKQIQNILIKVNGTSFHVFADGIFPSNTLSLPYAL